MPELPECEQNRRRVEAGALNRTITAVRLGNDTKSVDLPGAEERSRFEGRQFTEARRHGKAIFAGSATGPWIAVSLGMTGSLRVWDEADGPPDYTRITFEFEGGARLGFRCPRKLGSVTVIEDPDRYIEETGLGPDALEASAETLADRLGTGKGAIKSALMSQKKIAGIGNLWSDEALFQCGIAPDAETGSLSDDQRLKLTRTAQDVMQTILDIDTDYSRIPDDWLKPHRTAGADCPRCGGTIEKMTVGGRTAHYCNRHQAAG
ncbi:Fpg/Nei family DNA glycosylase [Histidinibacterium aquaticum]|uniref:Fpg/Nei family DNA glycosylase n=1 Tax=Histidinibacterium aquaticum TaxID=2613962 RepID=A0A5J5GFM6_9RHOB|nr:DNA-formamidopyrimidine glycosylase family protein [Histidinibacterium aquaticum]KAA9007029.1 Fpg/Nei family DNA glycosylase [Histidinibacterium aquaticum]